MASEESQSRAIASLATKAVNDYRFDYNAPHPEKREFHFSIIEQGADGKEYEVGLASNGGIIEIIGKKASRKTAFLSMLVAACFAEDGVYGNIKSRVTDKTVLWLDTEMSGDDFWYFQKRLHQQCGLDDNHPRLHPINMDHFETSREKLDVMLHILRNSNKPDGSGYFKNIGLVVLDGIADLITDTGNEGECREALESIKSVLNSMDCCLATVLHSDKKGQASRGTLGTLLDQKATSAIMMDLKNPGEATTVRPEKIRNGRLFHPYTLAHDVDGTLLINGSSDGCTTNISSSDFLGDDDSTTEYKDKKKKSAEGKEPMRDPINRRKSSKEEDDLSNLPF